MSGISSIGGQTDLEIFMYQSLAAERKPIDELEKTKSELRKKDNIYTDLKAKLREFDTIVKKLIDVSVSNKLRSKKAESSNSKYFTAETTEEAENEVNSVFVDNLASYDIAVSDQLTKDDSTVLSTGTHQFSIGLGSGEPQIISITVEESDTNDTVLDKIADAINDTGSDVNASVIYDTSTTVRLSLKSKETGSENAINLQNEGSSEILTILGFQDADGIRKANSGSQGGFIQLSADELNSRVKINGIDVIGQSNKIENVIKGIVINLHAAQSEGEAPLNLTVSSDVETTKKEIQEFIEKYNEIIKYLTEKSKIDSDTHERGDLAGDLQYSQLRFNLRWLITGPVDGVQENSPYLLSSIGIGINKDGTIKISDADKLTSTIENNGEAVFDLFNLEDGIGNRVNSLLDNFIKTGGVVDTSKKMITTRIKNIDNRIDMMEQQLTMKEESLRRKFIDLQTTLSMLQSQQSILGNSMFSYGNNFSGMGY